MADGNHPRLARPQTATALGPSAPEPGAITFLTPIPSKSQGSILAMTWVPTCISCHYLSNLAAQVAQLILQLCGTA